MAKHKMNRRKFLQVAAGAAVGVTAAACSQATPAPTAANPTAVPPTATSAGVSATVAPTTQAAASTPAAVSKYQESPMLAELVKAGKLPPVEERLPAEPVVIEPTNTIGKYGGTLRTAGMAPDSTHDIQIAMLTTLFRFSSDLSEVYPDVAEGYSFSNDNKTCTLRLRKGVKWSDGQPFTADDLLFYFEDWQFNKDLMPALPAYWQPGGEPLRVSKVDDYTLQFDFAVPHPAFLVLHQAAFFYQSLRPKHFLQQYHIKYNPQADDEAKAEGFDNWKVRFTRMANYGNGAQNPLLPTLDPWIPVKSDSQGMTYERNPYYFKVDPEGKQLPYVDTLQVEYLDDLEVLNMKVLAGELSLAGKDLLINNYPVLKGSEETGGYRVVMLSSERSAEVALAFNQNSPDPVLKGIFNDVRFRQALSVGINRNEINELVFLGQAVPRQANVADNASFYKKEWSDHYAQFDVTLAGKLLDEMGLDKKGSDGIRLRPDGKPLAFRIEYLPQEGPKKEVCELVARHWSALGIQVEAVARERNYLLTRIAAMEHEVLGWHTDGNLERSSYARGWAANKLGPGGDSVIRYCVGWKDWINTDGEKGVEPPAEVLEVVKAWEEWQQTSPGTAEYDEKGIQVGDLIANGLWIIGTVGHSRVPVTIKNELDNVFTEAQVSGQDPFWWGNANWFWHPARAEQWYLKA